MAAPVVESSWSKAWGSATTTYVFDKPSGTVEGDLLVVEWSNDNGRSIVSVPTGFLLHKSLSSGGTGYMYYKFAGASEPATYTFVISGSEKAVGSSNRISGARNPNPFDVAAVTNTGTGDSAPVCSSITTTQADCLLLAKYHQDNSPLDTPDSGYPSGYTGVYALGTGVVSGPVIGGLAHKAQASAGASGTATFDSTSNTNNWGTIHAAIAPAAGGLAALPSGVSVGVGIGSPTLTPGAVNTLPDGVSITVGIGAPTVTAAIPGTALPAGVGVEVGIGSPALVPGAVNAVAAGVPIEIGIGAPVAAITVLEALPVGVSIEVGIGSAIAWLQQQYAESAGVSVQIGIGSPTLSGGGTTWRAVPPAASTWTPVSGASSTWTEI